MKYDIDNAHSLAVSVVRGGRGVVALAPGKTPELPLELYEYESCPYCRKVREALTELDIDYVSRSAARGSGSRDAGIAKGGKSQFPYLVDPNTGTALYESEDIIDYLHATYGKGPRAKWRRWLTPIDTASSFAASGVRLRGRKVRPGKEGRAQPEQLLELWNFEGSPFCRKVREELSSLGLDSHVHNVGKRGSRRPDLVAIGGKMQVPYLVDPNTGTAMYESNDIIAYLRTTYG